MSDPNDPPFVLTAGDKANPLWVKLRAELEKRLANLRGKNDGPATHDETLTMRGQIQCLKALLALEKELPPIDG